MRFLINYASRSRPDNFFRGLQSIYDNFSNENELKIICSLDEDDEAMNNPEVRGTLARSYPDCVVRYKISTGKLNAVNREVPTFGGDWDVLLNMSDDMVVIQEDFDKLIAAKIGNDTDQYLHFRDTNHKVPDALSTFHIVGKKYFDRDKFIYHPAFVSVYADNLNDDLAKARGKYLFCPEIIFDHRHPCYRRDVSMDAQYRSTEDRKVYAKDRATYKKMLRNIKDYV